MNVFRSVVEMVAGNVKAQTLSVVGYFHFETKWRNGRRPWQNGLHGN